MTKVISLSQDKVALVDDEDYDVLIKFKWFASKNGKTYYAIRKSKILMHRIISNPPLGFEIDHINGDGLDNRKENLRIVTHRENCQNKHIEKSSKFPGVTWNKQHKKWHAHLRISGKYRYVGAFDDEIAAANAYLFACAHPESVPIRTKSSKYKGVCWDKYHNSWRVQITINGKQVQLGHFSKEEDAHAAYEKERERINKI
jgi:hypothetical protein